MTTHIAYNNQIKPLTPSTLEDTFKGVLTAKIDNLYKKIDRAKKPETKMAYRSLIAELNYKLQNL